MRINLVVKEGWILERCAREVVAAIPGPGVTINATGWPPSAPTSADLTYYLPMKDIRHNPGQQGLKVGLFTHGEERSRIYANQFDACVSMNQTIAEVLRQEGARRVVVIRPGTEPPERPAVFGVCGRVYGKGRKGAHLVLAAVAAGFEFWACSDQQNGRDAPCRITHAVENRDAFYRAIDYLVVTSTDEGGPMPVLEAIARGVPVIAPNVGWCWEFPCIHYETGSWDSLHAVLRGLTQPPTWKDWGRAHYELFGGLLGWRAD